MGWASQYIAALRQGQTVAFRPRGNSMSGKIESGQLCTVVPVKDAAELAVGQIVLCTVRGNQYLHLIKAIGGKRFQIGNNRGALMDGSAQTPSMAAVFGLNESDGDLMPSG